MATAFAAPPFVYVSPSSPAARFSVMLRMPGRRCTGVLVAPDVALTAAHCIGLKPIQSHDVRISFPTLGQDASGTCSARATAVNRLWGDAHLAGRLPAFDVGLVSFDCPLPGHAKPIALDSDKERSAMGTEGLPVSVVGYGNLTEELPTGRGSPKFAKSPIPVSSGARSTCACRRSWTRLP